MRAKCPAHFWCSTVTFCFCGFLRCLGLEQKIDSNITLLPLPQYSQQPSNTRKQTHANHVKPTLLLFRMHFQYIARSYLFASASVLCVLYIYPLPHPHFLSSLPVLSFVLPLPLSLSESRGCRLWRTRCG